MDSGNSGSVQSSSDGGDDQEYDSRAASISTYFNPPPPPQPPPHHHNSTSPLPFDPNSLLNFDPIYTTPHPTQPFYRPSPPPPSRFPPVPSEHINTNTVTDTTTTTTQRTYPHHALQPRPNPKKKRSRASRRAPTTVLTTDTTNFRAMVQEFTGIPPPPFSSSSSPFVRSSPLDLFGTPSSIRSNPFLLRPFAQKFQPPLLSSNSASLGPAVNYRMQNPVPSVGLDEFGLGHGLQNRENLFAVDGSERVSMGWGGAGVGPVDSADQSHLRLVNGNYDYSHGSGDNGNGNLVNFAASSSDFRGEKASDKICGRGEGNAEPWICSLDQ